MSNPKRSRKILLLIALLCLVVVIVYAFQSNAETSSSPQTGNQKEEEQKQEIIPESNIPHLEYPALLPNEKIISHIGYSLVYSEEHEQAKWIA